MWLCIGFFFLAPQILENAFHPLIFQNWIQKCTMVSAFNSRRLGDHSVRCILSSWSTISLQFQFSHFHLGQIILSEHKSVLKSWCVRKIQRAPSSHPGFLLSSHRLTLLCSAGTCFLRWWIFGNPPVLDILQMNWSHLYLQGSEWVTKLKYKCMRLFSFYCRKKCKKNVFPLILKWLITSENIFLHFNI